MKILVTGATSGLGRNASEWLLQQGHQVLAYGRERSAGAQLEALGAQFIAGDLTRISAADCRHLLQQQVDAVWHCAAKSSPWGRAAEFQAINTTATALLATAAGEVGIPRFIHISTPSVYFDFQHHHQVTETYRARRFANHYASSKYRAEQALQTLSARYPHTTYLLLRPRGLFGPHDRVILPRVLQQLQLGRGTLRLPRAGDALLDLTFVLNVVQAMFLATTRNGLPSGAIYNITNQQPTPLREMLQQLLHQELGLACRIRALPYPLLYGLACSLEGLAYLRDREPLLTRYSVGALHFDMTLCQQKARTELGYQPAYSLAQGIALTGTWLREQQGAANGNAHCL